MLINIHREGQEFRDKIKKRLLEALGVPGYNSMQLAELPNAKLSSEAVFWNARTSYSFDAEVWNDMFKHKGTWYRMMLYFYHQGHRGGGGFAVLVPSGSGPEGRPVEYYTWAKCDHTFEHKRLGNCSHRYICSQCEHSYDVDSSG